MIRSPRAARDLDALMLPGPYERWFAEFAGRPSPVERRASCDACAMLPGAPELPPEGAFDPATRCCTYHPHLAAHFVGGILDGGTDVGRARVRERIAARVGVTPLGLRPLPEFSAAYDRIAAEPGAFGRNRAITCPFLDGNRCSIWRHRGAACASFHCKFDRGAFGAALWNLLVIGFTAVERALARQLLARHGLDAAACDALLHSPADAALDARAWGDWRGREEEFFVSALRFVEPLAWSDVLALAGRELGGFAGAVQAALAHLDAPPPARVRYNGELLYQIDRDRTRVRHPALPFDPLDLPSPLVEQLAKISDAPLAELSLDADLARRLVDWQTLLPSEK